MSEIYDMHEQMDNKKEAHPCDKTFIIGSIQLNGNN